MAALLELEDRRSRVRLVPELGGAVADMTAKGPGEDAPVLRPWGGPDDGLFEVGSNLLVPFSNRISGGGFSFDGGDGEAFHALTPNLDVDPFPIHGDGLQKPWTVEAVGPDRAVLSLDNGCIGDFNYAAIATYALIDGTLDCTLEITNTGPTLPFGGGFHPWFPRFSDTRLRFTASSVWLEDEVHLPTQEIALSENPDWDIGRHGKLPKGLINNAFVGWAGRAEFDQPSLGLAVEVTAPPHLNTAIIYSPGDGAAFFCFEPVSHAVDAHNRPGHPGLVVLAKGETLKLSTQIGWNPLEADP